MGRKAIIFSFVLLAFAAGDLYARGVTLGPDLKIPPHYKAGKRCSAGRGYNFKAEAPNNPSTLPNMNLRVFKGEVIGFLFEVDAKEGWKSWYDEPEGKPRSHRGETPHYTQLILIKKGPTAAECKASKGPHGK